MEKNAAAGRTPSSLPVSTPPPANLNVSSPELTPLSPVHSNAFHDLKSVNMKPDPTNFNLPPLYTEDNRTARGLSSENSERLVTGGNLFLF